MIDFTWINFQDEMGGNVVRKSKKFIQCLFIDIGGVLLTNGWDHHSRKRAAKHFNLDYAETEVRHHLNFEILEQGKIPLQEYIDRVYFNQRRSFSRTAFKQFMFAESKPIPEMLDFVRRLKAQNQLKIVVVSNENRELNDYRVKKFKLGEFVDFFISSSFVHLRKPDVEIFKIAIDAAQVPLENCVFIDNTLLFTQVAAKLGLQSILHVDYPTTRKKLSALGLRS